MRFITCGRHRVAELMTESVTHLISIGDPGSDLQQYRPSRLAPQKHLCLEFRDKHSPEKPNSPNAENVKPLFVWLELIQGMGEMLVHCGAGMSRSPAIALLAKCFLNPELDPFNLMNEVQEDADYKHIWPNPLVVKIGDELLDRDGQVVASIDKWRALQP